MSASLQGKKILIIGGSSGFGLEVAKLAGAEGAALIILGRDAAKAAAVAGDFTARGITAEGHGCDARDPAALNALLAATGPVDHAISMVGGAMGGGFLSADAEEIRRAFEEKFFASLAIARTLAPHIAEGGSLTLTAGSGGRPHNASGAYLGNSAIATLVQGLGAEMAPKARANAVAPTWTPTGLWRGMPAEQVESIRAEFARRIPLGRTAEPAEVAQAYLFLMRCGFITGQTLTVDGGLTLVE